MWQTKQLAQEFRARPPSFVLSNIMWDETGDRLVDEGYSPSYGARPLRRAIMRLLEDVLAERMLGGLLKEGDSAIVDVDAAGNVVVLGANGEALGEATAISETPAGIS